MVAYSFKNQFRAPILSGAKLQTIRADRKRHARLGEELQLYTGMRTKHCLLIGRSICESVVPITIDLIAGKITLNGHVWIGGMSCLDFARSDGFESWDALREFWRLNHPGIDIFSGVRIIWGHLLPESKIPASRPGH